MDWALGLFVAKASWTMSPFHNSVLKQFVKWYLSSHMLVFKAHGFTMKWREWSNFIKRTTGTVGIVFLKILIQDKRMKMHFWTNICWLSQKKNLLITQWLSFRTWRHSVVTDPGQLSELNKQKQTIFLPKLIL